MISEKAESRGQISAQPLKGDTVTVSQSRSGRLSLKPPSEKYLRKVRLKNIFPRKMIRLSGRIIIIYWVSSDTPQLWGVFTERNMRRVIIKTDRPITLQPRYLGGDNPENTGMKAEAKITWNFR